MPKTLSLGLIAAVLATFLVAPMTRGVRPAQAAPITASAFQHTWERTDKPVADGQATRTWMWGPEPFTASLHEEYAETPGGQREVQYFDKSRMEITHSDAVDDGVWFVTNGLLVSELITGRMQTGDNQFEQRAPAAVNVAGDPDDTLGPTYASFNQLLGVTAGHQLDAITQVVARDGSIAIDESKGAQYGIGTARFVEETQRWIAAPFWSFMNMSGTVYQDGAFSEAALFQSPFYATGLPLTEPYWATVTVGAQAHDVLIQCFERRCLTFTPSNAPEWQVEMGNVGRHYYAWRHAGADAGPSAQANALAAAVSAAGNDEARYQALLGVMDAMGIGVYANDGAPLVRGAERGAGDFYLYDIEVRQLAAAIGRGDTVGVDDLALTLTDARVAPAGVAVDPALLRQVLLEGARAAQQTPNELSSLTPLIVRQLGLTQARPYDLFLDVPADELRFDALQAFLVEADILLPIVAEAGPVAASQSQLVAQSRGVLQNAALENDNPCDAQVGIGVKETWSGGKWFLGFIKVIGTGAKVALVGIDAIHGSVLAFSVLAYSLDDELSTHYGHQSPGAALNFRVKVEMVDELPENIVKCGWLLGVEFPKKGPIKDVSMLWEQSNLANFGTITCGDTCKKTGPDGVATLVFQPNTEVSPGAGMLIEERGQVTGVALYQSKHKNVLGSINQLITPKTGTTRWIVAYHRAPAYTVTMQVNYEANFGIYFPEGPSQWTNTGDGHMTYVVNIPAALVTYPRDISLSTSFGATGSGNYHTDQTKVDISCTGTWNGTWSEGHVDLQLTDEPTSPGEVAEWVRVYPGQPPIELYHGGGGCPTGADPFPAYYGALSSPPMFDLSGRTPQTFVVTSNTLCVANGTQAFTSCDATATWTITVAWATEAN